MGEKREERFKTVRGTHKTFVVGVVELLQ